MMTFATENNAVVDNFPYEEYVVDTVVSKGTYTKQKITNIKTGEVEWLEGNHYSDGTSRLISTSESENDIYIIENNLKEITITKNDKIFKKMDLEKPDIEIITNSKITLNSDWSEWGPISFSTGSKSTGVGRAGVVISVVATLLGVPPTASIAITVAAQIISENIENMYYEIETQFRFNHATYAYQRKDVFYMYKYSNYTGFMGTHTKTIIIEE